MKMTLQEQTNWCWAAVAAAIHNYLRPGDIRTQGEIATPVLVDEGQIGDGVDCTDTPGLCNLRAALHDALRITRDLKTDGFMPDHILDYESIKMWMDADRPIGARIRWGSGSAHFIAFDGYLDDGAEQWVHVQDPANGPNFYLYDDLVSHYPPDGHWRDTYLVKKKDAQMAFTGGV